MAILLPEGKQSFTNSAGAPLVGGKLYTYDAGTSNPRPTFSDAAGLVPNTNPVVLDSRGEATVFWNGAYKVVLRDASDTVIWTVDNVQTVMSALDITFKLSSIASVTRTLYDKVAECVSAKDFGATGDGVTDDSISIQNAIEFVALMGGGGVALPSGGTYRCNVMLRSGVLLMSEMVSQFGYIAGATPVSAVTMLQAGIGYVVDTPSTNVLGCGVIGINFEGLGAGVVGGGVRFNNAGWSSIKGAHFHNFADEGLVLKPDCGACTVEDILTTNCVMNRTRSARIAAVDIDGNDHFLSRIEAGISGSLEGNVQSASLYCVALAVRGANSMLSSVIGEISDIGIWVPGSNNRFGLCRGDLNYGHGWLIDGAANQFSACLGLNNSRGTTNTYDNWKLSSSAVKNQLTGCQSRSILGWAARYGFNDEYSGDSGKNIITDPYSEGSATQEFKNAVFAGSVINLPNGAFKSMTANDTTPSVSGYSSWKTLNTVPTTITDFTEGVNGQVFELYCGDNNTTVQHNGGTITLPTVTNKKLVNGGVYLFKKDNTTWRELSDKPFRGSATFDPASIANGASVLTTIAVAGAVVGDMVFVAFTQDLQGLTLTAYVGSPDVVSIVFSNTTGAARDLPQGQLRVELNKW